jgi:hypothetical protein
MSIRVLAYVIFSPDNRQHDSSRFNYRNHVCLQRSSTEAGGSRDNLDLVEFTFHNVNHFVGPGQNDKMYLRTLAHVTIDPKTGQTKVEILRDDVLCH